MTHARRTTVVALAVSLLAAVLAPAGVGVAAVPYADAGRIGGASARDVAIAISQRLYPDGGAGAVVLAREDTFPDALGAAALTTDLDAPLLLTPSSALAPEVEDEIDRLLGPDGSVYLLGGTAALSEGLERHLDDLGYRTPRFPGRDRVETAALIARFVGPGPDASALLVRASGNPDLEQGWVDSVSCGGYAADTATPILLTQTTSDTVADETLSTIRRLGVRRVSVCGGSAAVPDAQVAQLQGMGLAVTRYAGADRAATAVAVATGLWGATSRANHTFLLAPGYGTAFGFGLVAAPLSASLDAPILLVDTSSPTACGPSLGGASLCYLEAAGSGSAAGVLALGGTPVVSDDVLGAAAEAAGLQRDTTPPPVPANVTATDPPEDDGLAVDVSWDAVTDPSGVSYTVYLWRSDAASKARADALLTKATGGTGTTLAVPEAGVEYEIAVDAVDGFGNRSGLSTVVTIMPQDEVPAAPPSDVGPQVAAQGADLVISWVPAPEADVAGYVVERTAQGFELAGADCDPGGLSAPDWANADRFTVDGANTSGYVDAGQASSDWCYRYRVFDDSTPPNETAPSGVTEYDA